MTLAVVSRGQDGKEKNGALGEEMQLPVPSAQTWCITGRDRLLGSIPIWLVL